MANFQTLPPPQYNGLELESADFQSAFDFQQGFFFSAFVRIEIPATSGAIRQYIIDCVDTDDPNGRFTVFYSVPDKDFVLQMSRTGKPTYELRFAEAGDPMTKDEWNFVLFRVFAQEGVASVMSSLGSAGFNGKNLTLPADFSDYLYPRSALTCYTAINKDRTTPFTGDFGSSYLIEGPMTASNYDKLMEYIREFSPKVDLRCVITS